jgi:hypothetical protein
MASEKSLIASSIASRSYRAPLDNGVLFWAGPDIETACNGDFVDDGEATATGRQGDKTDVLFRAVPETETACNGDFVDDGKSMAT